jgi:hypothetical protein
MKVWRVQCRYIVHYANTVMVRGETPDQALEKAVAQASDEPEWQPLGYGPIFVDAIAEADSDPGQGPQPFIPVPPRFTERGTQPVVLIGVSHGCIDRIWIKHGPVRVLVRDYDAASHAADRSKMRVDRAGRSYVLTEWGDEVPLA